MSVIRRFVQNPVAANMLMLLILGGGFLAAFLIPRELFPEFEVDYITVTVPYLGASPEDIEEGICLKIEERVEGLEGIEEISSTSREGLGLVSLKLYTDADAREVLDKVKSEVDKIDFPIDSEDPTSVEVTLRRHVIHVAVADRTARPDDPLEVRERRERTLKEIAEEIRDELTELAEISQVSVSGVREYEISVEVREEALRRYPGLTLARISQAVRDSSFDLPAGNVKTVGGERAIRVVAKRRWAAEFQDIPVIYRPDGTVIKLGQIARVREGFEDVDVGGQFNGKPAALVSVFKTGDEDTIEIARVVRRYVDRKRSELPDGIVIEPWADMSKLIQDRLDLLLRNGRMGLIFVFLILWLFLGLRLSFWVAMGIPVSLLGAILVLDLGGMTLNMMSMFALIMALGLIVDDAIVVGENIYAQVEAGELPGRAAVSGTHQVLFPVIGAVVTTLLAFMPLMFVPGVMGRFVKILPITVITALTFSLVECLIILPPHLAHSLERLGRHDDHPNVLRRSAAGVRRRLDRLIQAFIDRVYLRVYRLSVRYRYVTLALLLSVAALTFGAWRGGLIRFETFPKIDSDTVQAVVLMPTGTPIERTAEVARRISRAALQLNEQYDVGEGAVVERVYSLLGQQSRGGDAGSHVAEVIVELMPAEQRGVPSQALIDKWRENVGGVAEALSLTYGAFRGGPGGKPFEIRLLGPQTAAIEPAADELKDKLRRFPGVFDIDDDALPGKTEIKIRDKPGAHALGIDLRRLAVQVRSAFYGHESLKLQRGRDEIKVMVRYPPEQRRSLGNVEEMRVRTDRGDQVPFNEVADVRMERGYTTLRRVGKDSVITVSADIDPAQANAEEILTELERQGYFRALADKYAGLKVDLRGQRRQTMESLDALKIWFPVALLGIYTILAAIFHSYVQPVIIMVAIPFGLIGAVVGHWLAGFDVTLLSMFGMVALAGIVVNDSLVLIDLVNRKIRGGEGVFASAQAGARGRFRPIFLTTATTVLGMTPLLAERSFQAQYLKPMVISLAYGLSFATLLTLLVVPCLYLIGNDVRRGWAYLKTGRLPAPEEVVKGGLDVGEADRPGDAAS